MTESIKTTRYAQTDRSNPTTSYHRFRSGRWRGWIHHGWLDSLGSGDPLERLQAWDHNKIHARPMSCTWLIDAPDQKIFAKYISSSTRSGLAPGRLLARTKLLLRPSVALRTARIRERMARHGLRVPETILAARCHHGWYIDELLVSKAVEGAPLNKALRQCAEQDSVFELLEMVGRSVAKLHRCGFIHGHLLPGHIFVTPGQTDVTYIDNDETRWRPPGIRSAGRRRNLIQFQYCVPAPFTNFVERYFLDPYFDAIGLTADRRRRWSRSISQAVQRRVRKHRLKSEGDHV